MGGWWWLYALSVSKIIFRARTYYNTVSILIQSGDVDEKKEEENRKPLVALYHMPGI